MWLYCLDKYAAFIVINFLVKVKISPACHEGIEGVVIHIHSFLTSAAERG